MRYGLLRALRLEFGLTRDPNKCEASGDGALPHRIGTARAPSRAVLVCPALFLAADEQGHPAGDHQHTENGNSQQG